MSNAESARNGNSPPSAVPIRSSLFTIPWYRATKIENISRFVETLLPDISKSKLYRFIIFSIYIPQDWTSKSIIRVSMLKIYFFNYLTNVSKLRNSPSALHSFCPINRTTVRTALKVLHRTVLPYECSKLSQAYVLTRHDERRQPIACPYFRVLRQPCPRFCPYFARKCANEQRNINYKTES